MEDCTLVSIPVDISLKMTKGEYVISAFHEPCQEAVGALMHLTCATRPDTAFSVGMVARFEESPNAIHMTTVERIFRYLQVTQSHGSQ